MNSLELYTFLSYLCESKTFDSYNYDVLAADEVQKIELETLKKRSIYICNTSPSNHKGTHWVALYIDNKKNVREFFDSYGNNLEIYGEYFDNVRELNPNCVKRRLQKTGSQNCGQFCLFYAKMRLKDKSILQVENKLCFRPEKNNYLVNLEYRKLFDEVRCIKSNKCCNKTFQTCESFHMPQK